VYAPGTLYGGRFLTNNCFLKDSELPKERKLSDIFLFYK